MSTTESGTIEAAVASITEAPAEEVTEIEAEAPEVIEPATEAQIEEDVVEETEAQAEDYEAEEDVETQEIDDAGPEEPEFYTVKVDGVERQVTLADLKQGYSGQEYVQKGMAEVAKVRKEAEAAKDAYLKEQQKLVATFQKMQSGVTQPPTPPSRELFENDPIGYMEEKLKFDEAKEQYDAKMAEGQKLAKQQQAQQQQAYESYVKQEVEAMKQTIPEFGDPKKATVARDRLMAGGETHYGFSAEEVSGIVDHRAIKVLNDALKYQEIVAGKSKAEAKAKPAKPVIKPGAKKVDNSKAKAAQRRKARLKKSGSIDDALGMIVNSN